MDPSYLPTASHVLLGLLMFQNLPGSALRQRAMEASNTLPELLTQGHIDMGLRLLTRHGLIKPVKCTGRSSGELVYTVTPAGEATLRRCLAETATVTDDTTGLPLRKIPWSRLVPHHTLTTLLGAYRQQCLEALDACEAQLLELTQFLANPVADDVMFPSLVLQLRIAELRTDIAWTTQTLARLRAPQL